jgi:hypothetical protein
MMIEQSDIVEIYSNDDFSSVTIKMKRHDAEIVCKKMNLTQLGGNHFLGEKSQLMALVKASEIEFFSR